MPFSEKKGRFLVSVSEQPKPSLPASVSPSSSPSPLTRAVKRGRFLVSCLPCSNSPCLAPTLSLQQEEEGVRLFNSSQAAGPSCASRSTCSSDDTQVAAMDHSSAALEVTSPCRDTCPARAGQAASTAAAGQCVSPAQSPERKVRFSETAEDLCMASKAPAQPLLQQHAHAQEASTVLPAGKRHQVEGPKQLKHTRSYCSGRLTIQEAVYIPSGVLHRSTSAPECAGHLSSSLSSCNSLQDAHGPFAVAHGCSSSSPGSSGSFAQPGAGSCADLYAANQLMSGLVQLQHQQQAVQQQPGAALTYHPGAGFPAAAHAAAGGGLVSSMSVPVPMLSSASSEEEGSLMSSLISSSDYLASEAGAAAAGPFSSAGSSRHSSGKRRGSGSNLLSSCYSGSAELLSAAAAAAAVGHHQHQHMAPKRSPSMTYFRRGRFLVQTTMG